MAELYGLGDSVFGLFNAQVRIQKFTKSPPD